MKRRIGVYTVTADANDLEGWTAATLAMELLIPLSDVGICVQYLPKQIGGGGLRLYDTPDPRIIERIQHIVEQIIERGPE